MRTYNGGAFNVFAFTVLLDFVESVFTSPLFGSPLFSRTLTGVAAQVLAHFLIGVCFGFALFQPRLSFKLQTYTGALFSTCVRG